MDLHGAPRLRGQRSLNTKKQPEAAKAEPPARGSIVKQRLEGAIKSKRLDLSLARHVQVRSDATASLVPFHHFPTAILSHELLSAHLTELWLTNHQLSSLPTEIAVFKNLRVLGLAGNKITALPKELGLLAALESLYLENNRLQVVPASVIFPTQLRELRLDNNQLSVFPMQITKLRLLSRLGLSHNLLKALPEQIHRLRNLVELDLDFNRLDANLPEGFASLKRLQRLGLDGNYLDERPKELDGIPFVRLNGNRSVEFLANTATVLYTHAPAVPRRHDGHFQSVERGKADTPLEGLVPSKDQNVLNAAAYESTRSA